MSKPATPWTLKTVRDRCSVDDDDGCWIWQQATTGKSKAPQACIEGRSGTLVARWLMAQQGHAIAGRVVTQKCCEPLCVNPAHLKLVTKSDVLRRAYATGARSTQAEYLSRLARAQRAGLAKLDMAQARVLRDRMRQGETIEALRLETGLWASTLRDIKHGRSWREAAAASSAFTYRPAA